MMSKTRKSRLSRAHAAVAIGVLGLLGLGLGGCAGQNTALLEANRNLQERNSKLTQDNDSLHSLNQQLQSGLSARDQALAQQQALLEEMKANRSDLAMQIDKLMKDTAGIKFGSLLDPETNQALSELASQHPDLLEYDAQRGLVRFKSDVTFDSGSDKLRDTAKSTLRQFAGILTTTAAAYDCRIVGHTDAQPIIHSKFPSNMHLSCARAISVRNDLVAYGVAPERCEAAGRGEFKPLETNGPSGKSMRNRRVEVYLERPMKMPGTKTEMTTTPTPMPPSKPTTSGEDYMK